MPFNHFEQNCIRIAYVCPFRYYKWKNPTKNTAYSITFDWKCYWLLFYDNSRNWLILSDVYFKVSESIIILKIEGLLTILNISNWQNTVYIIKTWSYILKGLCPCSLINVGSQKEGYKFTPMCRFFYWGLRLVTKLVTL